MDVDNTTDATPSETQDDPYVSNVAIIVLLCILGSGLVLVMLYGLYHTCKLYRRSHLAMDSASYSAQHRLRANQIHLPPFEVVEDDNHVHRYGSVARSGSVIISVPDAQAQGEAISWAQRMMSGDRSSFAPPSSPSRGANDQSSIIIPVKQTICILEPDGKHYSLGISQRLKDSAIQVRPQDLGIQRTHLERSMSVGEEMTHRHQTTSGLLSGSTVGGSSRHEGGLSLYGTDAHRRHTNSSPDDQLPENTHSSATRGEEATGWEHQADGDVECPNSSSMPGKKKTRKKKKKKKKRRYDAWCQVNMDLQ
ncbi:hypothetical protein PSENEW3_00000198 [Picochlorum sp. SENEW3]|nr:hypothetical protein PSENEW3_00000198 [Picochlorum sp. SENEW3]